MRIIFNEDEIEVLTSSGADEIEGESAPDLGETEEETTVEWVPEIEGMPYQEESSYLYLIWLTLFFFVCAYFVKCAFSMMMEFFD